MSSRFCHIPKSSLYVLAALLFLIINANASTKTGNTHSQTLQSLSSMPLSFTENVGQWDEGVRFRANAGGATMWFGSDGAFYQFSRTVRVGNDDPVSESMFVIESDSVETLMIKASFVGAKLSPQLVGVGLLDYKCNYFSGSDQSKWYTNVPNYSSVIYEGIYDGIDLKYYGNGHDMEYDFIVAPGADFSQISVHYEGAESLSINGNGELVVATLWGEVVEQRPVVYQIENGSRVPVSGVYSIRGDMSFGFELDGFDRALPLVIDPVLSYSSYLGGSAEEKAYGIEVDDSGAVYVTGYTLSTDFPTLNEVQSVNRGDKDVFVTKINASGSSLVYSTYLGGTYLDESSGIALDGSGAVYVTGRTTSLDYPIRNHYAFHHGSSDIFVSKLNNSGDSLIYSTFIGGSNYDKASGIAVDGSGMAYVAGLTQSTNYPRVNYFQAIHRGEFWDVCVTKLSSAGNSLIYSTYLGGTKDQIAYGIAIDDSGSAYVTGNTTSIDFPLSNPYDSTLKGTGSVFITKFSSSGDSLVYSSYLGGGGYDKGLGIAVDASGSAYVTGYTSSSDFPTLNSFQDTRQGGYDVFVTKFSSSGTSLDYSALLGGGLSDIAYAIALDASGSAYVTGTTKSTDFPLLNPYQDTHQGSSYDLFVSRISSSGSSLLFSTYFGSDSLDYGYGIAADDNGMAYVTGWTSSPSFPTLNPYEPTYQGDIDAFVAKLNTVVSSGCCVVAGDASSDAKVTIGDVTFLISWLFAGGADPVCLDEANVNGDSTLNIGDVTFLISWLFAGGADPVCGTTGS